MDSLFAPDMLPVEAVILPRKDRTRRQRKLPPRHQQAPQWPLNGAINVVLFAGMGGACQGLEDAGLPVHVAVNHDEVAIAAHRALNPHTKHLHADIYEVCPVDATGGRPVNILWLSPDCTDHSVAKGGAPRSPRVRSMPWQGCRWVGVLRKRGLGPQVVYLENVREIRGWSHLVAQRDEATGRVLKRVEVPDPKKPGKTKEVAVVAEKGERVPVQQQLLVRDPRKLGRPRRDPSTGRLLVKDGRRVRVAAEGEKVPDNKRVRDRLSTEGRIYRAWKRHMEGLGARYEDRDLCCANHEVPTSRTRLFGVAVFSDDHPICWPKVTHGPRHLEAVKAGKLRPYRAAAEIIDWSLPLPSIFERRKELAAATRKRIAVGMKRFVLDAEKPFLIHLTHGGRLHDTDDPSPTMTCAHRGEVAVVSPTIIGAGGRAAQVPPMDAAEPMNTSTTKEDRCVVAATLVGVAHGDDSRSGSRTYDINDALRTATGSNDQAVIAAHLTRYHGERRPGEARGVDPTDPLATLTTENRFGIVGAMLAPHVTKFRNGAVGHEMDEPLHTVTCSHSTYHPGAAPPLGVVGAVLAPAVMANNANNIGAAVDDAVPTVTTGNRNFVIGAHLTKFQENSIGQDAGEPIDTVMAGAARFGVVGAFLEEAHGNSNGRGAAEPMPTQTQVPHHSVIGATMVQTGYGEREGQAPRALDIEEPIGTQVAGGGKHAVVGAWMVKNSTDVVGLPMEDPLSTVVTTAGPQAIGAAYLTELRGTSADGQPVTEPAGTICTGGGRGGGHHAPTAAFLTEYYGTGGQHQGVEAPLNTAPTRDRFAVTGSELTPQLTPEKLERARQVAAFLREHGVWDDREFVTVGPWIVIDIVMRMLTPSEAAAAHELTMPDAITLPQRDRKGNIITDTAGRPEMVTRPLTKTEAMRLVGNSVPKRMAMLLAQANAVHALYAPSRQLQAAE